MILPLIPTHGQQIKLAFDIQFNQPINLQVSGYSKNGQTVYFNRIANPGRRGIFTFEFPMPITPDNLRIKFENKSTGNELDYCIKSIKANYLNNTPIALDQQDIEFIDFIKWFSSNASILPVGKYRSKSGNFLINYMPYIVDEQFGVIDTPARVDHLTGEIQVAQNQFKYFTVPISMIILSHEYTHWKYDTRDEIFCDLEALRICLGLGFPKTECIYAFTNIFSDTGQNIKRMNYISNYVNNFKQAA